MPLSLTTRDLTIALALKARNELRAPLQQGKRDVKGLGDAADQTKGKFKGLGDQLTNVRRLLIAAGIGVAVKEIVQAGLEMERINLTLLSTTGSAEGAGRELAFLRQEAERLGLNLRSTAQDYAQFLAATRGTNLEGEKSREIFSAVVQTMAVLGKGSQDTTRSLFALQQMVSKGVVSQEELRRQLGESLPGAFKISARAMGVTTVELSKMVESGKLLTDEFLPKLAVQLEKEFGDRAGEAGETARASFERLKTALFELQVATAKAGIVPLLADVADGLKIVLGWLTPVAEGFREIGRGHGALFAFLVARIRGEEELAKMIAGLRLQDVREMEAAKERAKQAGQANRDLTADIDDTTEAAKRAGEAMKKLAGESEEAFAPAIDAVKELLGLMQSQAEKAAELREKVFEATGGAAKGFFDDQIRTLREEARAMLEADIQFFDVNEFVKKRLAELRERAAEGGAVEQVQRLDRLAKQNTDDTLNFVREINKQVGEVNRRTDAMSEGFSEAQAQIVEAGQAMVDLLPADKQEEIAGRLNSLLGIVQQMGADSQIEADFDINRAIAAVREIQTALAAIPRTVVTQHIIQRVVVGDLPPPPDLGSRATGGLVERDGMVQVHQGERIVSNHSQTVSQTFNFPSLRMSEAEARSFVRNVVAPELKRIAER